MHPISFLGLPELHAELMPELQDVWAAVLENSGFIGGPLVERFEADWADYCGTSHCVGVASGTAALELSLRALGIGPGDEVIVPANSFIATAAAVALTGAEPVFVDVDPDTLLMTASAAQSAITPRTAAIIPVHLFGNVADMDAISRAAARAGLAVIEDAAQAHGATLRGRRAGGLSRLGCFSFYPGKNLGAFGDAGAVVTNDPDLAARIRALSNHGRPAGDPQRHDYIGTTGRLDALQAGILSVKLRHLDRWTNSRARISNLYLTLLEGLPLTMPRVPPETRSAHHLAAILCDERDQVRRELGARGVPSGIHYAIPCHRQPAFADRCAAPLPVAEAAAARLLSLPMHPHLTEEQIHYVADTLRSVLISGRPVCGEPQRAA